MRILAIYRHYWPDTTPYARLLRAILEHLASRGHTPVVFTAQPSYNDVPWQSAATFEILEGVAIHRIGLLPERKRWPLIRLLNSVLFLAQAIWHVLRNRSIDLIVCNSHPPILMGLALRWIRCWTGIPYLFHLQDIHPESLVAAGKLKPGRLYRWLQRLDAKSCAAAKCVVTLSEDMRGVLEHRLASVKSDPITSTLVINNFALDRYQDVRGTDLPPCFVERVTSSPRGNRPVAPFKLVFAGNIGHFQGLERIIDAMRRIKRASTDRDSAGQGVDEQRPPPELYFLGAGGAVQDMKSLAGELLDSSIFFLHQQSVEVAFAVLQRADLAIVSLASGVYRYAYPSKTMTCLAAGTPVLTIVEPESQLARDIMTHDLGYSVEGFESEQIASAIQAAIRDRGRWTIEERTKLKERAERLMGKDGALRRWDELVARLDVTSVPVAVQPRPSDLASATAALTRAPRSVTHSLN